MPTWSVASWFPALGPALICFAVAIASPLVWVPALRRWGVIDVPNARSSHALPTIRGAGLAPAGGVIAAGLVALVLLPVAESLPLTAVLGLAVAAAALGLAEDVRGLSIGRRITLQLILGAAFALVLCRLTGQPALLALPLAVAVAGYVNVANFMDGVDAMSAQHGLLAGGYFVVVGLQWSQPWLAVAGSVVAAAFSAFAPWNLLRGRVFLGDVGSYLLGASVAGCVVAAGLTGVPLLTAVAPTLPYLADTVWTLLSRLQRGENITESHRGHVYQRLTDRGWTHLASAGAVAAATIVCSAAGLWSRSGGGTVVVALVVIGLTLTAYLTAPRWAAAAAVGSAS